MGGVGLRLGLCVGVVLSGDHGKMVPRNETDFQISVSSQGDDPAGRRALGGSLADTSGGALPGRRRGRRLHLPRLRAPPGAPASTSTQCCSGSRGGVTWARTAV
jgi:hypothetical protein